MALRKVLLGVLLVVGAVVCLPRDSTAVHANNAIAQDAAESYIPAKAQITRRTENEDSVMIPGRIACPHDEATEDADCLKHCLPKGYSYGLCINKTCTCI